MKFVLIIIITLFTEIIDAQYAPGSREIALSHSDVSTQKNTFAIFGNPAGLSNLNNIQIGIFISPSPFGLKELSNVYAAYTHPTKYGNFSIGIKNFGYKLFRENDILTGYSIFIYKIFQIGFVIKYNIIKIQRYGSKSLVDASFGSIYNFNESLKIGFSIKNFLRTAKSIIDAPLIYEIGLSYLLNNRGSFHFNLCREINFPFSPRFGVEYFPFSFFTLLIGIKNKPAAFSGGLSIKYKYIKIGFAVESHSILGITYQGDIIITLE